MIAFHLSPFIVLIELLATTGILLFYQERRSYFWPRLLVTLTCVIGLNFLWGFFPPELDTVAYALQFFFIVIGITACFKLSFLSALFWGAAGLTIQHLGYSVMTLVGGVVPKLSYSPIIMIIVFTIVFISEYFLLTRKLGRDFELKENYVYLTIISLIAMFTTTFLNSYRMNFAEDNALLTITSIYSIICSVLTLALQLGLFEKTKMEQEVLVLEQIIANDRQHYDDSMQNMEMLNMYCHDLKYFLRRNADEVGSFQQQAEKFLSTFDAEIATYNHALDTILTEKSLYCANNDIQFTCMADGQLLEHMDTVDIYSLFGNLLSNAIEAVSSLENKERRMISLTLRRRNDFVHILIENYYDSKLEFHNGLPASTKEEAHLHGYGLKSVRYLVEKYHGNITISADDDIFRVNILMPIA
ncbi:GHKL domain-containing protein [Pseudobutyrivibrio sp. UC1225]|uniref:ATP-binding protein n=1 Tax=Pseudobutyrivibrio sp. UC1225 TaxID=1798185 RepID=UPI0008EF8794|nr:ATP-binding protein [Pseudobutyrivibrio sp. UC1225]SFO10667.1 GHKL domain-containing protein [Pseudobutyrivibrio sp. UC1225]